ncbi:MAG: CobD/CbiB family cobalamin biosynthesis protein [Solidesulfovibrio sp.]|uniref:CobD/CbiB family cobalamin biosynthesis protein n=1 Tax=Solidesulfovibrio sp. TaxID=2910990 RepID=UPI002B209F9A|nr:CobD/CbiB family cobalamin biosynthesis protein [Solidesulfovibrio sp.]MEA4856566.1 CobD/CbiB family cobalamin biosynthesis protein [Solidesulfovibrio sp.]
MSETLLLLLAVALDLLCGDPPRLPHPVRAIGAAYAGLDRLADGLGWRNRLFGAAGVLLVAAASAGLVRGLAGLPLVGWLAGLYFAYAGLALGGLLREGRRAARFLEANRTEDARAVVAGLVSRDVSALDADGLWRALAESVAENANDAFVAPLFWLAVSGPAGLWAYKAVSTADSMWGYRTPRYVRLGFFAARADDVLAWLPARLTVGAMWCAAWLLGLGRAVRLADVRRDARKSASPNAGWPMAAAAWLCGAAMGGEATYFGARVIKPIMGPPGAAWNAARYAKLDRMVVGAGLLFAVIIIFLAGLYL